MDIQFIGATGTVTGSKYLLSSGTKKILVDCGLFQGLRSLRSRNRVPLPFKASQIQHVILTHAHIDHTGFIPVLIKHGFKGKIYCTAGTEALCRILLPDSGYLQEEDARFANKHGFTKHNPALPLYTRKDAEESLKYFHPVDFETPFDLGEGLNFTFFPAGHILGSSLIKITNGSVTVLFTGDLGRLHHIVMRPPFIMRETDYLVLESTYGNHLHSKVDPKQELADVINKTCHRSGVIIVPAFAVGRAQTLLYLVYRLRKEGKIPNLPVYLDSPMATNVTGLYSKYKREHSISEQECHLMYEGANIIKTPDESKALDDEQSPKIIISASGMATGGRVLHHLKAFISDPRNTILFTGFQAAGTRGHAIAQGTRQIKMHGEYFPVRAEIVRLDSLSAHADYQEILSWLSHFKHPPKKTFLTHGEPTASAALCTRIQEELGWACHVPEYLERAHLS